MADGKKHAELLYGGGFDNIDPVEKEMTDDKDEPIITITVNAKVKKGINWQYVPMKQVVKLCSLALRSTLESLAKICKS